MTYGGLRSQGWDSSRIKGFEQYISALSMEQRNTLVDTIGIGFLVPLKEVSSQDMTWTIADDFSYEEIIEVCKRLFSSTF